LDWYLGYFDCWLRQLGMPAWRSVVITEGFRGNGSKAPAVVYSVDEYRPRFSELLARGWPWVNVHAAGLLGDDLLVSIDVPTYDPTESRVTAVNISGPATDVQHNGFSPAVDSWVDS
jgi:hypothetical protein